MLFVFTDLPLVFGGGGVVGVAFFVSLFCDSNVSQVVGSLPFILFGSAHYLCVIACC